MKKLLLILLCLPMIGFGQFNFKTYVPDNNFESYLEANGMGDGVQLNDSINTLSIEMLMFLDVSNQNISDLTGIEDFTVLSTLNCSDNLLTSLDVTNNTYLQDLRCYNNLLASINLNACPMLMQLSSDFNQLTALDLSDNFNLRALECASNYITELDLSNNPNLEELHCSENLLNCLNLKSGGNQNIYHITADTQDTVALSCVEIDDLAYSNNNWINNPDFYFDIGVSFSENCNNACSNSPTLVTDIGHINKTLSKIVNILGENVMVLEVNKIYFYIYDDGTVEKRIVIE